MKDKVLLIVFTLILSIICVLGGMYLYKQLAKYDETQDKSQTNIYNSEEKTNLISNVDSFLFTQKNAKLIYEGGPSHWGSRTITFANMQNTSSSKIVNLHIIDESDLKGESPKKEWDQKWEATSEGSLYIDNVLMLKSPIVVGQNWNIYDYSPVVNADKKYRANIKITSIQNNLNDLNIEVKKIYTTLTIDDIKTVDGSSYTETRVFESGIGLREFKATEPTISDLTLSYWLDSTINIQ